MAFLVGFFLLFLVSQGSSLNSRSGKKMATIVCQQLFVLMFMMVSLRRFVLRGDGLGSDRLEGAGLS